MMWICHTLFCSGTSGFTMTNGSLTSKNGHVFHVTNTNAVITLKNVSITNEDDDNILLSVCADGWSGGGNVNASGATVSAETGSVSVTLDNTSTWTLTGDSYITEFSGDAGNIISHGYTLYVNGAALTGTN